MATVAKKICDLCRSDQDVDECIIVYRFELGRPWAIDLCGKCYGKKFGDLEAKAHPVKRGNIRPQHRMKETFVTAAQLAGKPRERS